MLDLVFRAKKNMYHNERVVTVERNNSSDRKFEGYDVAYANQKSDNPKFDKYSYTESLDKNNDFCDCRR